MSSVRTFAECFLSGTRQTSYLLSVTLGIILHTATIQFAECQTLGEIKHSAYVQFAECPASDTRQNLTGVTPLNVFFCCTCRVLGAPCLILDLFSNFLLYIVRLFYLFEFFQVKEVCTVGATDN
jgi:hypothetical protein